MKNHFVRTLFFLPIFAALLPDQAYCAEALSEEKAAVAASIDAKADRYTALSRRIWEFAELAFVETDSSKSLQNLLREEGFAIRAGVAGLPTAFIAEWGEGAPVLAFLGEFDALPGMSQTVFAEKKPLVAGAPGHGCGHNLLGVGAAAAAVATKEWLEKTNTPGTVRFYGCPAEERGNGKRFLVLDGLFDDVDAAITWHPASDNSVNTNQTISINTAKFKFFGEPAHAAVAPHHGRSALDGVEAMNYMVNLMREHVDSGARIHYVITDGGEVPNIVPEYAEVYYWVRHHDAKTLDDISSRIAKAAEGAAMGTGTRVEYAIKSGTAGTRLNRTLSEAALANMQELPRIEYQPATLELLRALCPSFDGARHQQVAKACSSGKIPGGSDVGFVSMAVPTIWVNAFCMPPSVSLHTWKAVVCAGSPVGEQGMLYAAKTMALAAVDVYGDPELLKAAKAEFREMRGTDEPYRPTPDTPELDMYRDTVNRQR